jgi:hypothetical protein
MKTLYNVGLILPYKAPSHVWLLPNQKANTPKTRRHATQNTTMDVQRAGEYSEAVAMEFCRLGRFYAIESRAIDTTADKVIKEFRRTAFAAAFVVVLFWLMCAYFFLKLYPK